MKHTQPMINQWLNRARIYLQNTRMGRMVLILFGGVGLAFAMGAGGAELRDPATVKLIIFGGIGGSGGNPSPTEAKGIGVARIEALPIQGFVYNLSNNGGYFPDTCMMPTDAFTWTWEKLQAETEVMKGLPFRNSSERLARIDVPSLVADWFDDAAWAKITANVRLASRAAKEGNAAGFLLDTEQYGPSPFNYTHQAQRLTKDFDAYRAQVRKRGAEFMKALTTSLPAPKVIITFGNSAVVMWGGQTPLYARTMGLWPAFLDGMMDAGAAAEIIDGFEQSYEYRRYDQFKEGREIIKGKAAEVSQDPERYRKRIKVGFALWLRRMGEGEGKLDAADFTKNNKTPEELKHALYYAMTLSDGYVWLYSFPWFNLPKEYLQAIQDARKPQPLDFKPREFPEENKPVGYIMSAKGRPDCVDATVFVQYFNAGYREVYDFPKKWRFRLDPQDAGLKAEWFARYDAKEWMDLEIGDWWEPQLKTTYLGYAWYYFEWEAPKEWSGKKLVLAFGAVDEDAWVWLNGEKLGDHALGPDGWNSAFEFEVTGKIKPGARNTLCVRVHNSAGVGGIWKSVKIFERQ